MHDAHAGMEGPLFLSRIFGIPAPTFYARQCPDNNERDSCGVGTSKYHDLCIHASTSVLRSRHAEIITRHRRRQTGNVPSIELKVEAIDAISVWKPRQQGIDGRCISVILAPCRRGSGGSVGYRLAKNCQSVLTPFTLRLRICNSLPTCTI